MRISAPTFTQTPNDLFDHWLPHLNESELKVLLVIMRKTFGWHKVRDKISTSQMEKLTGLCRKSIMTAVKSLQEKGIVIKETIGAPGREESFYELVVEDSNISNPATYSPGGGRLNPQGGGDLVAPQKKELNKFKEKQQQQQEVPIAAAVVFLDSLPFSADEKTSFASSFSESQIQHAAAFYKGKMACTPDFAPDNGWAAFLASAIRKNWAIPVAAPSKEAQRAAANAERDQRIARHRGEALKLHGTHRNAFKEDVSFYVSDLVIGLAFINVHGKPTHGRIELQDPDAITILEHFIETNLAGGN